MARFTSIVLTCALAACGSSSSSSSDAAGTKTDAPASMTVTTVSCTGITPAATVTINSNGNGYNPPTTTINQGQVVLFTTASDHDVTPGHQPADSAIADPGIHVDFNMTGCRMFTETGSYGFHCSIHGFNGTITVQ